MSTLLRTVGWNDSRLCKAFARQGERIGAEFQREWEIVRGMVSVAG